MNKYLKKIVSTAMSAVMVAGYFVPFAKVTAEAATINGPSFEFEDSEIDQYSNTIIEGTTAKFRINHVEKFSPQEKPFEITVGQDYQDYSGSDIQAELSYAQRKGTIETKKTLFGDGVLETKTFTIKGRFNVIGAEAIRVTEVGEGRTTKARAHLASNESLTSHSRIKIECTKEQDGEQVPAIKISPKATDSSGEVLYPSGIFNGLDEKDYVSVNFVDGRKDAFVLGIGGYNVNLYPELTYQVPKEDEKGNIVYKTENGKQVLDTNGKPIPEMESTNEMQVGTTFDIEFDIHRTPPLVLNVVSPEKSVQEIADKIANPKERHDYIAFGEADDRELYINDDFVLKGLTERYGTQHEIKWEYVVCNEDGTENTGASEAEKAAILLPEKQDQKTEDIKVGIRPREDDTFIKLTATVSLKDYTDYTPTASFVINIRGTGTPPSTWNIKNFYDPDGKISWNIKHNDDEDKSGINHKIPSKLDINNGKNKNFPLAEDAPHEMGLLLNLGKKNAASVYAKIKADPPENLEAVQYVNNQPGKSVLYNYGSEIQNPETSMYNEGQAVIGFIPRKTGKTKITVEYYAQGATSGSVRKPTVEEYYVNVIDTSPSRDATLRDLQIMNSEKEKIDYGFDPNETSYVVEVPNAVNQVSFKPVANSYKYNNIQYRSVEAKRVADGISGGTVSNFEDYKGSPITIDVPENGYLQFEVKVTPESQIEEDCLTYTVEVVRQAPSDNAYLKDLKVSDTNGNIYDVTPTFDKTKFKYSVELPFKADEVIFLPDKENKYADYQIGRDKDNDGTYEEISDKVGDKSPQPYKLTPDGEKDKYGTTPEDAHKFLVKVTPENEQEFNETDPDVKYFYQKTYYLDIFRREPNRDATAQTIKIYDALGKEEIKYTPSLNDDFKDYHVQIPFETDKLRFSVTPSNYDIKKMIFTDLNSGDVLQEEDNFENIKGAFTSKALDIKYLEKENEKDEEGKPHKIEVKIIPESGVEDEIKTYTFIVYREPPNTDPQLKSLTIKGDENIDNKQIDYDFFPEGTSYNITVPYETQRITMTPTTVFDKPKEIRIKASTALFSQKVECGADSSPIKLEKDKETVIKVTVIAQDGKSEAVYTYNVAKEKPNSDANLLKLDITGVEDFKPVFRPSETSYDAKATEGATQVVVTPTASNKHSSIWIGKDKVESGTQSNPIGLYEEELEIVVKVTAQDGTTSKSYVVDISNPNAIEKTDNADLKKLNVYDGDMQPRFRPSITSYNVAVSDDSYSIEIDPQSDDEYATVQVFQGSREIGDEKNNYEEAIEEGENKFTVKVTSSDGTKTREYNIFVNKNVKDKEASYKAITPDDVNFETEDNIIVINVEKYPIVTSDVFIEMRDMYPEKTLVLEGNDYSLEFKGSELSKNIPHQLKYDFKLFFETPEEDEIDDLLYDLGRNRSLHPVYMYFRYHGALPGPCIFNISIGNRYRNDKLYMNYYNDERDRIDYYGYVITNSKGNFSVKLEHFSTYFLTRGKVNGSEDRSNSKGTRNSTITYPSSHKQHPNTGGN